MNINMGMIDLTNKSVAIVMFGPATPTSGMRSAEYYQVTIDPGMVSGDYIRFGKYPGDEIMGWQRVSALTIVQILGEWNGEDSPIMTIGQDSIKMSAIVKE